MVFWPSHTACRIFVFWPEMKHRLPAVKAGNPNHQGILPKWFFKNMVQTISLLRTSTSFPWDWGEVQSFVSVFCPCMIWPHLNVLSTLETWKCLIPLNTERKEIQVCWTYAGAHPQAVYSHVYIYLVLHLVLLPHLLHSLLSRALAFLMFLGPAKLVPTSGPLYLLTVLPRVLLP